jgi:hypothetical protein
MQAATLDGLPQRTPPGEFATLCGAMTGAGGPPVNFLPQSRREQRQVVASVGAAEVACSDACPA